MSVSSTSPRTTTILTATTNSDKDRNSLIDRQRQENTETDTGSTAISSGASPNRDTSITPQTSSSAEATSSSGSTHKKTTPPKKPNERASPTMRSRSTSQPVLMITPEKAKKSQLAIKPQPAPKSLGSPPTSPRSPRSPQRLQSFVGETAKETAKETDKQNEKQDEKRDEKQNEKQAEKQSGKRIEKNSPKATQDAPPHTRPVLSARSQGGKSELKPKQQAALDMADLITQHQILADGTAESGDFSISVDQLPPALKKIADHQREDKIAISKLIDLLFTKTLRGSEGWSNAHDMYVKFKIKAADLNQQLQSGNERAMNEAKLIIESFAASIAGSFFTLSRMEKLTRLPASLIAFLQQIDHRHLENLLGDGKTVLSQRELDKLRRDRIADVLINKCLAPQLAEAFSAHAEENAELILRNQIKRALHAAFTTAASGLLAESLKNAPDTLVNLFRQRRIGDLVGSTQRKERTQGHTRRGSTGEQLISPRSPKADRTWETRMERKQWLSNQLAWVKKTLQPVMMPIPLLKAIKAKNKDWVVSLDPLQIEVVLSDWQQLAAKLFPDTEVTFELSKLLKDELEKMALIAELQGTFPQTDLYALGTEVAQGLHSPSRARPLSLDLQNDDVVPDRGTTITTTTTTTTTTSDVTLTMPASTGSSTKAAMSAQVTVTPRSVRNFVPGLNLSLLSASEGSPYKAPSSSSTASVSRPPSGSVSLPASLRSSPEDSPLPSPLNSPFQSPRSSPERSLSTRGTGEGEALNSSRRRLNNRRQRDSGQFSPRNSLKVSPRIETPRTLTPEQRIMASSFAAALVGAMQEAAKSSTKGTDLGESSAKMTTATTTTTTTATDNAEKTSADHPTMRLLTNAVIRELARFEIEIPIPALPAALLEAMALQNDEKTVKHNIALKTIVQEDLRYSKAGKTLIQMKLVVMGMLKSKELKRSDWTAMENQHEVKEKTMSEMKANADATAHISFGAVPSLAQSGLPPVLIQIWKEADAHLCTWAAANPQLTAAEVRDARSALGFDLLVTRSIYPLVYGAEIDTELVVPGWFASAVREAHSAKWPAFFADFVRVVDAERAAASKMSS